MDDTEKHSYDAFISYRRRDGKALARWIRSRLKRYRIPQAVIKQQPELAGLSGEDLDIYLDTAYERPATDFLTEKLLPAIERSKRLIAISTPSAFEMIPGADGTAQPNWLMREIEHFIDTKKGTRSGEVFLVLGPGAPENRFPGVLDRLPRFDWIEFRAFNGWRALFRSATLDAGLAKIAAGVFGVRDENLPLLLREEERRRHRLLLTFGAVATALALVIGTLFVSWYGAREAGISANFERRYTSARQLIDTGAIANGVDALNALVNDDDTRVPHAARLLEAWSSRLVDVEKAVAGQHDGMVFRWRGRNYVKDGARVVAAYDGAPSLMSGVTPDKGYLVSFDSDRVGRIRALADVSNSLIETPSIMFEPSRIYAFHDGALILIEGGMLHLHSDEDEPDAQDVYAGGSLLLDRNTGYFILVEDPRFFGECEDLQLRGHYRNSSHPDALDDYEVYEIGIGNGRSGDSWTIRKASADNSADRTVLDFDTCEKYRISKDSPSVWATPTILEYPRQRVEHELWEPVGPVVFDPYVDLCLSADSESSPGCLPISCQEANNESKSSACDRALDADISVWLSPEKHFVIFTKVTGNQSADEMICRVAKGNLVDECVDTSITARQAFSVLGDEAYAFYNSVEVYENTVQLIDLAALEFVTLQPDPKEQLAAAQVSAAARELALVTRNGEIWLYLLKKNNTAKLLRRFAVDVYGMTAAGQASKSGQHVAFDQIQAVDSGSSSAGSSIWILAGKHGGVTTIDLSNNQVIWSRPPLNLLGDTIAGITVDIRRGIVAIYDRESLQLLSIDDGSLMSGVLTESDLLGKVPEKDRLAKTHVDLHVAVDESDGLVVTAGGYVFKETVSGETKSPLEYASLARKTGVDPDHPDDLIHLLQR